MTHIVNRIKNIAKYPTYSENHLPEKLLSFYFMGLFYKLFACVCMEKIMYILEGRGVKNMCA